MIDNIDEHKLGIDINIKHKNNADNIVSSVKNIKLICFDINFLLY
jgi:hypothetical protein